MFIGVVGYCDSLRHGNKDKITVFDTEDGTVEVVRVSDVRDITIANVFSTKTRLISCRFMLLLHKFNVNTDCVKFSDNELLYRGWSIGFGERIWRINNIGLNTNRFPSCSMYDVSYIFEFRGYLVIRLYTPGVESWRTLVLKSNGFAAYWTKDMKKVIGDRDLAVKIDMLSEV